jgi:PleD family two-component response regulator
LLIAGHIQTLGSMMKAKSRVIRGALVSQHTVEASEQIVAAADDLMYQAKAGGKTASEC